MLKYFFKRVLFIVPSLLLISMLMFFLKEISPGNPALTLLENNEKQNKQENHPIYLSKEYLNTTKKLNLHLPSFYFNLKRKSSLPEKYNNLQAEVHATLSVLAYRSGSAALTEQFFKEVIRLYQTGTELQKKTTAAILYSPDEKSILNHLQILKENNQEDLLLKRSYQQLKLSDTYWNNFIPTFKWNGFNNQYHFWISQLIKGNLGTSHQDGKQVSTKIKTAVRWTILLSGISLILAFLIAVPLAVWGAQHHDSPKEKWLNRLFFGFYAIPNFWLATLLIMLFGWGGFLGWLPSYGTGTIVSHHGVISQFLYNLPHFILPLICLVYSSLAFIYRQMKSALLKEMKSDYILTAKSKGLRPIQVWWKHAFKNASFPLITMLGASIPLIISGSFAIEYIFAIPGMGMLSIEAFFARDYPVILGILVLSSTLTLVGIWLADLFYHFMDPRINLGNEK